MARTTGISVRLISACIMALSSVPAWAADEDTQFWIYNTAVVPLGDGATGNFELSPRFREGPDQLVLRGTVDFRLDDTVRIGGGGAYVEYDGGHEARLHQQVALSFGELGFRTRMEERFFAGEDRPQLRIRQRVNYLVPLEEKVTWIAGSAELLYIARPEDRADKARVDTWRFNVGAHHRFSDHFEAGVGYLLMIAPREGAPDRVSHVPQLLLVFRP